MAVKQARQQKPAHQGIAEHGHREDEQAGELKPVPRGRRAAAGANRLLGRERFAATFAEKRVIQGSSHGAHRDLLLSYAARFVFLSASFAILAQKIPGSGIREYWP